MTVSLHCITGPYAGQEFELDATGIVIGRDSSRANVILTSPAVSREHARVFLTPDERVGVEDLNSSNGTFVVTSSGRKKISGRHTLNNGDRLMIGLGEEFVFEARCPEPATGEVLTQKVAPSHAERIKEKMEQVRQKAEEVKQAMPDIASAMPEQMRPQSNGLYDEPMEITEADLATPLQRLGGRLVDGAVAAICFWITFLFSGLSLVTVLLSSSSKGIAGALGSIGVGYLVYVGTQIYFLCTSGQTIGKKLMGTRIARLDGRKASVWSILLLRMLAFFILTWIPFIGWAIGLINLCFIFRSDRRMLHDFLAGTMVLKVPADLNKGVV